MISFRLDLWNLGFEAGHVAIYSNSKPKENTSLLNISIEDVDSFDISLLAVFSF